MTAHLMFCVADEAKPLARKLLKLEKAVGFLRLVTSRFRPSDKNIPPTQVSDDEPLESAFIGASNEECQQWALGIGRVNYIDPRIIVVLDTRSAQDGTISLQYYAHSDEPTVYEKFGPLPPMMHTWYQWRIDYRHYPEVNFAFTFGDIGLVEPTYFGLIHELEDEHGVFNVSEASELTAGKDHERLGKPVFWDLVGPHL